MIRLEGIKVAGNKVTADNRGVAADQISNSNVVTGDNNSVGNTVIIQRLDPSDARNQRNHKMLRQMVRSFWVDGVLKSSLYNEVLIRLNMEERPKAVENRPWDLILKQPGQPASTLPHGLPIIDIFDQMNQLLLILGEPGSGKTTTLLKLADELLKRAESDPTHPTPVVFNLSSWAEKRQSLTTWLVDELRTKYSISKKLGLKWIDNGELLPLLDGLDEVQESHRNICVSAINEFRQEHLCSLVVSSRTAEYERLTIRLKLQGAVSLQALTWSQIDDYLGSSDSELSAVRKTLSQDTEFHELATSPLMLSIIAVAYHGLSPVELPAIASLAAHRRHLFDAYTSRMFAHRGIIELFSARQTLDWLSWLARYMYNRQQTIFLIESLQPFLFSAPLMWIYLALSRIILELRYKKM